MHKYVMLLAPILLCHVAMAGSPGVASQVKALWQELAKKAAFNPRENF